MELLDEATNAHHIGHALHLFEHAHHSPFLLGTQLRQGVPIALQAVVKNLAQRRVIRCHFGRHTRRQIGLWQTLRNLGPRVEAVGVVIEDEVDHGQAKIALGAQRYQARRAIEFALKRLGDLTLNFFRGQAWRLGNHTDLHIGHIGVGLDGSLQIGINAVQRNGQRGANGQQAAAHDKCYE